MPSSVDQGSNSSSLLLWQLNLLVATKVGEEGLDIQTCSLVIRFDLPETVASFIQSRGRARMPQSEYVFLVNRCFSEIYWFYHISLARFIFFLPVRVTIFAYAAVVVRKS